ncbi:MAG TPA: pyridoxamine 5'-phosphate oxidase family protein [Propionibacterium sp.]|nr:pyridoxamine 5'-phosphate oxidase family protein [Propionibacterium sp.]
MPIPLADFIAFVTQNPLGVVATVNGDRGPEAALLTFAPMPDGDVLFDTQISSRKAHNLAADPRVALVIGTSEESSLQVEGTASLPRDADEQRAWARAYEERFPDSQSDDAAFTMVRVHPTWLRHYIVGDTIHEGEVAWA